MLDKVKLSLRVSNTAFDDEIQDLIDASKIDLGLGGVSNEALATADALIQRAIIVYARGSFGMANPDSDKYLEAYENIRMKLALSGEHNVLE
jgi:hypothetical protein